MHRMSLLLYLPAFVLMMPHHAQLRCRRSTRCILFPRCTWGAGAGSVTRAGGTSMGASRGSGRTRCRCCASGPMCYPPLLPGRGPGTAHVFLLASCTACACCSLASWTSSPCSLGHSSSTWAPEQPAAGWPFNEYWPAWPSLRRRSGKHCGGDTGREPQPRGERPDSTIVWALG